jgi:tRNA threonylcarbamoyladenosine biosynthesis protein TsaB
LASLFIDTTYDITLGILDDELSWVALKKFSGQKASVIIQSETLNLAKSAGLGVKDFSHVVTIAGPGFYTGLRLSEGFADVVTFLGGKHLSLLSYDIPFLTGHYSGTWMTKAYRGEYFFHHWNGLSSENLLVSSKDLKTHLDSVDKSRFYIHSDTAIDDFSRDFIHSYQTSSSLLETRPQEIFKLIFSENRKSDSFYFRAPEDEFKVSL